MGLSAALVVLLAVVAAGRGAAPARARAPGTAAGGPTATAAERAELGRRVSQTFERACLHCHGPAAARGGLRLDSREAIAAGGDSGPALGGGPGGPSLLLARLTSGDEAERMPRDAPALEADEIDLVRAWIDAGAPFWDEGEAARQCGAEGPHDPGPHATRTLEPDEYANILEELLGFRTRDVEHLRFGPSVLLTEGHLRASEAVAERAVAGGAPWSAACAGLRGSRAEACAREAIAGLAARAFRRPPDAAVVRALEALHRRRAAARGAGPAAASLLVSVLQRPELLYVVDRTVPGTRGSFAPLDGWSVAARLGLLFRRSLPDEPLVADARAGRLSTAEAVGRHARRLLAEPGGRDLVHRFFSGWLGYDRAAGAARDRRLFPDFSRAVGRAAVDETRAFIDHVVFEAGGDLRELLLGPYTFVNRELAAYYGLPAPEGDGFARVSLAGTGRAGILTQPSVLIAHADRRQTSPVHRGKLVRTQLLCTVLPDPPVGLDVKAPDLDPALSTRARFERHAADPTCAACHRLMDPIGLAFEGFDATGRGRARDGGVPVDTRGEVVGSDVAGRFDGVAELAARLAASADVRSCFVSRWFRHVFGRPETAADRCALAEVERRFDASGGRVTELVVALVESDTFRFRRTRAPSRSPSPAPSPAIQHPSARDHRVDRARRAEPPRPSGD